MMHQTPRSSPRRARSTRPRALLLPALFAASLLLGAPRGLVSHEIPERVALRAWVLPRGDSLVLLLRVPLESMRDLDFPERADGALDIGGARPLLDEAARTWLVPFVVLRADGVDQPAARIVSTRLALPDDRSFDDATTAARSFAAPPIPDSVAIPWRQALFDVALVFARAEPGTALSLDLRLARLGVRTYSVLHIIGADGDVRTLSYVGDPGSILLAPGRWENLRRFLAEGFRHILGGLDHLLFVFCLVLPLRRWRPLVAIVTAFTVAHSITLGAAVLGVVPTALWFPPLIELAIALSILWLTVENMLLPTERLEARWRTAFVFGLIHGFGFSFALREQLQFAGGDLLVALGAFNLGVEAGQLAVVAVALLALKAIRRQVPAERQHLLTWVGSAFVAHAAYHWAAERVADLSAHDIAAVWSTVDGTFLLLVVRGALVAAVAWAAALGLRQLYARLLRT